MSKARDLLRQGKSKESATALAKITDTRPDYFLAQYNLGLALSDLGDYKGALRAFQKALAIRDAERLDEWTISNATGWAQMLVGEAKKAEQRMKEAEAHKDKLGKGDQGKLWNNLGFLYMNKGEYAKAEAYLNKAKALENDSAVDNLELLGKLKASKKDQ